MLNSLNINFSGIEAFEHLFSVKFYEKRDQDEISWTILKIIPLTALDGEHNKEQHSDR